MLRAGSCSYDREREVPEMRTSRKQAVIDTVIGKIDRRIFSEQAIYDDEMEKIFGCAWLMIGQESLVPVVDDFFHTYMGEDPVVRTRDGQGRLHALPNMCRHRGNRVCRVDDGNAKRFTCTYHGWTYRNDGALEYVPGSPSLLQRARPTVTRSH
jgi:phenylpropionate dioxygenase-like ring-hydroxylating dioxygenase large terminal subunit